MLQKNASHSRWSWYNWKMQRKKFHAKYIIIWSNVNELFFCWNVKRQTWLKLICSSSEFFQQFIAHSFCNIFISFVCSERWTIKNLKGNIWCFNRPKITHSFKIVWTNINTKTDWIDTVLDQNGSSMVRKWSNFQ